MACIYKITNKVNGKIYIGYTSRSPYVRFKEHVITARHYNKYKDFRSDKQPTYLHKAILKYGEDNFKIDVLEKTNKEKCWEGLEKYYIRKYKSNSQDIGYNLTEGGENPPIHYGESNVMASLTDEDFEGVVQLLKEGVLTQKEISEKYQVDRTTIERINVGTIRYSEKYDYPIRKKTAYEVVAFDIVKLLTGTTLSHPLIAEVLGIHPATVGKVGRGHHHKGLFPELKFPIRDNLSHNKQFYKMEDSEVLKYQKLQIENFTKRQEKVFDICFEIIESESTFAEIRDMFNVTHINTIHKINNGDTFAHLFGFFYFPLDENKDKNKLMLSSLKAVETIPLVGK